PTQSHRSPPPRHKPKPPSGLRTLLPVQPIHHLLPPPGIPISRSALCTSPQPQSLPPHLFLPPRHYRTTSPRQQTALVPTPSPTVTMTATPRASLSLPPCGGASGVCAFSPLLKRADNPRRINTSEAPSHLLTLNNLHDL